MYTFLRKLLIAALKKVNLLTPKAIIKINFGAKKSIKSKTKYIKND